MATAKSLKTYYHRFLGLGWARVFLVLAVIFVLISLVGPMWALTYTRDSGDYDTATYGWTSWTTTTYQGGSWSQTSTQSYNARSFSQHAIANAVGASYLFLIVFLIVLIIVIAVFSLKWFQTVPGLGLLIVAIAVSAVALLALFDPIVTVPPAAASDLAGSGISGFWGSGTAPFFGAAISWGAAIGWWCLLIAVILGILGGAWPFLHRMRQPIPPPPPRQYQIEP